MVVVGMITYLSLVIGELVPKRLAMKYPERIACVMAGPMAGLAWVATPLVNLLARSTHRMLRLFGVRDSKETGMSREELHVLLRQGMTAGTINEVESQMMQRVIEFEKLDVYDIMIPRPKMIWIEQDSVHDEVWPTLVSSAQTVFPVYRGRRENLVGAVTVRDIYGRLAKQEPVVFQELMQEPLWVPETQKASDLLEKFRQTGQRAAFVINEFGSVMGMVTLMDLMESIVGEVPSREEQQAMPIQQREDGSWLIDGLFEIEKLSERLEGFDLPQGGGKEFQTVSGWFIRELGRLPVETDRISTPQWVFEVVDIDGVRVDKIIATRRAAVI
jgi:putative hemolysin